jgi:4'-phosphopantetheinyl transferase
VSSEPSPNSGILLAWVPLAAADQELLPLLDERERARYRGYAAEADRGRFLLGAALLRVAAAELLGRAPGSLVVDRRCATCGGWHGRPALPGYGLDVSVTHSGLLVAVAVTGSGRVGVDAERIGGRDPVEVSAWCAREARFKCGTPAASVIEVAAPLPGYRLALATDRPESPVRLRDATAALSAAARRLPAG